MNVTPHPYLEYPESLDYIQDAAVKEAFEYLANSAQHIPGYTARPRPHGYITRNLHYFDATEASPYAFTVSRHWLLFYLRSPAQTHPNISVEILRQTFVDAKILDSGEITFKIRTIADARFAMQLAFPGLAVTAEYASPDEIPDNASYVEGAATVVRVNSFERNRHAREACIRHYGYKCNVCGFSFSNAYGAIGEQYIHVHHVVELASIREQYEIDPIRDLRPVCPNCHAMLHRRSPALTIEELKQKLAGNPTEIQ